MTHRCKHVEAIKAIISDEGGADIQVAHERRLLRISWLFGGRRASIVTAAHPRDVVITENVGRQAVHRAMRQISVEARAS